jgi:hypothetical protein
MCLRVVLLNGGMIVWSTYNEDKFVIYNIE